MAVQASTCLNMKRLVSCSSRGEPVSCAATHEDRHPFEATEANSGDDHEQKVQQKKPPNAVHVVVVVEKESHHSNDHKNAECRICQEEEEVAQLDNPCACTGSLLYAHRKCVQRWCDEKGDTNCEICQQPYKSDYTTSPQLTDFSDEMEYAMLDIEAGVRGRVEEESSLVLMAAAHERRFLDAQYEEANSSSVAYCRSAALILMAILLLRHAITIATTSSLPEDNRMILSMFLLRVAGFMLPCYIMVRAMNMLQRRHHQEEVTIHNMHATTTEVAIILQAGALPSRGNLS